tara:strand:+ start:2434 stop:2814 length:381 start_codon:yes stop_codon:yes gene_type:complete
MSRCAAQLWEITMAEINYVEFHNFEVDCSEIRGDESEILEIMQNSEVSIQNLCESKFGYNLDDVEERDELAKYLNDLIGNEDEDRLVMSSTVKEWISGCEDFETLLHISSLVTENLFRVIKSRGQL